MELTIKVVGGGSETLRVVVEGGAGATVGELKRLVEREDPQRFPAEAQRLIFQGQILQDASSLGDYNITTGMAVHLTINRAAAAAKAAPSTGTAASSASATAPPPPPLQLLRSHLEALRQDSPVALQTVQKICDNIVAHPSEPKYRKLRLENAALRARLFDRPRGMDCVRLLGFAEGVEAGHVVLVPTAEKWEALVAMKRVVDEVARSTGGGSAGASSSPSPSPFADISPFGGGFGSGFGGIGGVPGGSGGGSSAELANAVAMLQNPMMQQMMQNHPMMQQLAQVNPMAAQALQNPAMLQDALRALEHNPAMRQHVDQIMQDPAAIQRLQQTMLSGGSFGGMGGGAFGGMGMGGAGGAPAPGPGPGPVAANPFAPTTPAPVNPFASATSAIPATAAASTPTPPTPTTSTTTVAPNVSASATAAAADEDATVFDEDEIARAIARSLEEH